MEPPRLPLSRRMFLQTAFLAALLAIAPRLAAEERIVVGLSPEYNVFEQFRHYRELLDQAQKKAGVAFAATMLTDSLAMEKGLREQTLDAAFLEAHTAARLLREKRVAAIAKPLFLDGASTCAGKIITRQDSRIDTAANMNGEVFSLVDRHNASSYLFALAWLKTNSPAPRFTPLFTGSHDGVIAAVLDGTATAGAASSCLLDKFVRKNPEAGARLKTIATSAPLPATAFFLSKNLDAAIGERLRAAFLSLHLDPKNEPALNNLNLLAFTKADESDYQAVETMAAKAGFAMSEGSGSTPR